MVAIKTIIEVAAEATSSDYISHSYLVPDIRCLKVSSLIAAQAAWNPAKENIESTSAETSKTLLAKVSLQTVS